VEEMRVSPLRYAPVEMKKIWARWAPVEMKIRS
jgi:hypothetical protein